jgi:hypothetical protein
MQYKTGLASVTNGSAVVTGSGTAWLANVSVGDGFVIAGVPVPYTVAAVGTDTQITLSAPWAGATASGSVYAVFRDFTALNNIPEMSKGDIETATIFTRSIRRIDQQLSLNQDAGALTSAGVYDDTTSGIAGTTTGDYFFVPESSEFVLYLNNSDIAVEQVRFASLATALQYAADANADADRAERAADAAELSGSVYDDTAAGIAATGDGDYFSAPSGNSNIYLELYRNDSGSATLIATYPTKAGIDISVAAALASELAASASEANAATSESNAAVSESAASTSESNASTSEGNAASSASAANTSASNASTSAGNASASESNASASETNAGFSETAASTSETNAQTSESSAASSASSASTSADSADTSASAAATSETAAGLSENNAATSESNAGNSKMAAATSESNAADSETAAGISESAAATSESNASNSAAAAAASYDSFDDRYLGAKATAPTTDNDGNPLLTGALYFNSTENGMRVWTGTQWVSVPASPATTTTAGVVEKATTAEAEAGTADKFPDAAGVHAAAGSVVAAHEAATDPHAQYTTDAEATVISDSGITAHANTNDHPLATTTAAGFVKKATTSEAIEGAENAFPDSKAVHSIVDSKPNPVLMSLLFS